MKATAIIYEMPKKERKEQEKIRRKLFGYVDKSNKCKYTYEREGLLNKHIEQRWGKSVMIIPRKKERTISKILKNHELISRKVRIILED